MARGANVPRTTDIFHRPHCPCSPSCGYSHPDGRLTPVFFRFHRENPHVLDLLVDELLTWRRQGLTECGIDLLFNHVRWLVATETHDSGFKMPNNHRAFYARWIEHLHPALAGSFRMSSAPEADEWLTHLRGTAVAA